MPSKGIKKPTVRAQCSDYVTGLARAVDLQEVVEWAVRERVTTARDPESSVRSALTGARALARLPGDQFASLLWLYDDTWLTLRAHHPTAHRRWICPGPALHPVGVLLEETGGLPLASGGAVTPDHSSGFDTWVGPGGWLPEVGPGTLVGLRLRGGRVEVSPVTITEPGSEERTARVRSSVERHLTSARRQVSDRGTWASMWGDSGRGALDQLRQAVRSAGIDEPAIFAVPTPPLEEVLNVPNTLGSLWADIPDPWVRQAHELRRELQWMEAQDRSARARLEEEDRWAHDELARRRAEEGLALDRWYDP